MLAQVEKLKEEKTILVGELDHYIATNGKIQKQLDDALEKLKENSQLKNSLAKMEAELIDAKEDLDDKGSRLRDSLRHNMNLEKENSHHKDRIRWLETEKASKSKLVDRLGTQIKKLTSRNTESQLELSSQQVQTKAIRDKYRACVREMDRMRLELETLKEGKHQYMLEKSDNFKQVAILSNLIPKLEMDKQHAKVEKAKMARRIEVLQMEHRRCLMREQRAREEASKEVMHLAAQVKEMFNLKWTEQRKIIADAKEIGTLPPPKKGQTRMDSVMKKAIAEVKAMVLTLEGKVDQTTDTMLSQLKTLEASTDEQKENNTRLLQLVQDLKEELLQSRMKMEPLETEMQMRQEEMILHEKAAVQAALANVRQERAQEEEEERAREATTRFGRSARPVTAPVSRSMNRARIWGNHLKDAQTDGNTRDFNFWAKVR